MNEVETIKRWLTLQQMASAINWVVSMHDDYIVLVPDFGWMQALRTQSVDEATGFIKGFTAGRNYETQRR